MSDEFGSAYASVIESDLALTEFQDRTASQCLTAGEDLREVWLAICRAKDVPQARWHGLNKNTKK